MNGWGYAGASTVQPRQGGNNERIGAVRLEGLVSWVVSKMEDTRQLGAVQRCMQGNARL